MRQDRRKSGLILRGLLAAALMVSSLPAHATAQIWLETPRLAEDVAAGRLPPVAERIPQNPRVIDLEALGREPGRHGGQLRMLMGRERDIRILVYYGYSRLIGYNEKFELVPDILERFEVEEGRRFTFHLRPGHKWSDGQPFTAEDFRYYWEDVANNPELSRNGPHGHLRVDGKPPTFEIIDPLTVRYTWHAPNPYFLPAIAGTRALYIFSPSHYLKQFHARYADPENLAREIRAAKVNDWVALHRLCHTDAVPTNPDMPTLEAWRNITKPPTTIYRFVRNPFFHRVDTNGRQLPYVDEITLAIGSASLIPAKTGSGESDLQGRYIRFDNYTFLKAAEKRNVINVKLWERGVGSAIALYPNMTTNDPVWRKLFQDVRVRRALSQAIDRREINEVIYFGLGRPSANTVLPASPLYREEYAKAHVDFDIEEANRLLDEAGLQNRDAYGIRLLPDGRRADIIVEAPGDSTEQADVLELVRDTWQEIGIRLFIRPTQRDLFRKRVYAGDTIMSVWSGYDNALPTADMSPMDFAPTSKIQYQWPAWGDHYWTKGKAGTAPELAPVKELLVELENWRAAKTDDARRAAWHRILEIHAENVFTIGIVNGTKQPIAHAPNLRNVPENGIFNYFPGAYYGIYMPDTFWFAEPATNVSGRN
jgi:peptide/nickel transport system substrate-binding protein